MPELLAASLIRDVPDFPKPGIIFKDITPILQSPAAVREIVDALCVDARKAEADVIVGVESRGFLFGVPVAMALEKPFVLARKIGKLPYDRITETYDLEYGSATVEMHTDAVQPGQRAIIMDDLLATGGTARASAKLVERLGGTVAGFSFLIELGFLGGRQALSEYNVHSLITF